MIELSVSAFSSIVINRESLSAQAVDEH
ncbi:hypothetical protein A2U01_0098197, partial [Trifolium medium]|nr:hypothetical protein [Trifolium medium]